MIAKKVIISHIKPPIKDGDKWFIQTNEEHSENVSNLSMCFAEKFFLPKIGKILGILHDVGKEQESFQKYIRKESGYENISEQIGEHKHAYVGGIISREIYGAPFDILITNPVISHHTHLHDTSEISAIVSKEKPKDVAIPIGIIPKDDILNELKCFSTAKHIDIKDFHHISRLLYSCLVDADYLDTEHFMNKRLSSLRAEHNSLKELYPLLEHFLRNLKTQSIKTPLNTIRECIQMRCRKRANDAVGFFSLTVPTGGGKTLSSLVWAMSHALHNGQERIIIAIPYTSIIAQTASVLKSIFGEDNVLEHHSNFNVDDIKDDKIKQKAKLAAENWDYPIIVTTNVQLFESMFASKPSECRKLHNICNSVIILDEVQTLPSDFLLPIVDSLKTYNKVFNCSVLFTTASQPILSGVIEGCNYTASFSGIENITEIIPYDYHLYKQLRRADIYVDNKIKSYDDVTNKIIQHKRVLCIVNTRRDAKEIFDRLPKDGITIHLSKMMCSSHIKSAIDDLKKLLQDNSIPIIRVVSTQLIESGVDIDFPVVFRQEAGVDSILQAAGRCNREGKLEKGKTYVFSLASEHPLPLGSISDGNNARLNMGNIDDWFSPETMNNYFINFYSRKSTFDKIDVRQFLYNQKMDIDLISKEFKLINDNGYTVIVNWGESSKIVKQLKEFGVTHELLRKLNQYTVSLHSNDFKILCDSGAIEEVTENIYFIRDREYYNNSIGLVAKNRWMDEILIK